MAGPYFMAKPLIQKHNVAVFSSNYNLYGDLSWRVMETLRMMLGKKNVEVYSVDEAFVDLEHISTGRPAGCCKRNKRNGGTMDRYQSVRRRSANQSIG